MYTEKQYQNIENQMIEDIGLIQKTNGLKPNRTSAEKTHQTLLKYLDKYFQLRERNWNQTKGDIEKRFNDLTRTY